MKRLILLFALILFPLPSLAATEQNKTINILAVESNGSVSVAVNSPQASSSCSWSVLAVGDLTGSNAEVVQATYSMLMAAKAAGRPVDIEFSGCTVTKVTLR